MTGPFWDAVAAVGLLGVLLVVQSAVLCGIALFLARHGTQTAAVRVVIYQATFAAMAVLPVATVLFHLSGGLPQVGELAGPWANRARVVCCVIAVLWGIGAAVELARIVIAHRAMRALRRRASRLHSPAVHVGLTELAWYAGIATPEILISDEVKSPILTGALRPAIVLPEALAECSVDEGLLAVLEHELAHQVRHDCLAKLLADVLCALFFPQPLLGVLATRMEDAADEAADDIVLSGGATAQEYARELCNWAEEHLEPHERAAIGVVRLKSALEHRVERITEAARLLITKLSRVVTGGIAYTMALLCILIVLITLLCSVWLAGRLGGVLGPARRSGTRSRSQAQAPAAPGEGIPHG